MAEKVMTVNEAMVMMKTVRGRLGELSSLRQNSATREVSYYKDDKKVIEPLYDVKMLDKKCTELENFLFIVETKIKQSNAITKLKIDGPEITELLSPIV